MPLRVRIHIDILKIEDLHKLLNFKLYFAKTSIVAKRKQQVDTCVCGMMHTAIFPPPPLNT